MAVANLGAGIGRIVSPITLYGLFNYYGYTSALLLVAAISMNGCVAAMIIGCIQTISEPKIQNIKVQLNVDHENKSNLACVRTSDNSLNYENGSQDISTETHLNSKTQHERCALNDSKRNKQPLMQYGLNILNIGFGATYCICSGFLPALVKDNGLTVAQGAILLSISSVSDGAIILFAGYIIDRSLFKPYKNHIINLAQLLSAICTLITPIYSAFTMQVIISLLRGMGTGVFLSQRSNVVANFVEMENYGKAVGQMLMAFAIGASFFRITGGK